MDPLRHRVQPFHRFHRGGFLVTKGAFLVTVGVLKFLLQSNSKSGSTTFFSFEVREDRYE